MVFLGGAVLSYVGFVVMCSLTLGQIYTVTLGTLLENT